MKGFGARSSAPGGEGVAPETRGEEGGKRIGGGEGDGRALEGRVVHGVERQVAVSS